ncbi:hypothetical protein MCOR27_008967 [Pyricularia oryzae]|uniref:Nucleic acid-binding, OB-fold protein n=2 Tax=Pyricularia TaxID=48558 RepID=A0ABQ8NIW7_PYRGI|nr:hypothetical protein MCOR01_010534 [Pyricularia oryzae]KAI6297689.1 hypothetical protein MCOR33_006018 [Pyricularia grisea]KAH9438476.1 hypothetical protein MCOR02_002097 [Pyricularia oryzae]KAI6254458.1 hypothetical protein MCOR19_009021 [Pyricularia oryzae]KAI6265334.1 hypothetical protein MCOR26_010791 [Pyricularia oryzae]
MASKVLIFAGAPASDSLDWTPTLLLNHLAEPIARFAGQPYQAPLGNNTTISLLEHAVWRSLPLDRRKAATAIGDAIPSGYDNPWQAPRYSSQDDTDFFTTGDITHQNNTETSFRSTTSDQSDGSQQQLFSQFCEKSLAVHDDIPSSELDAVSSQEQSSFLTNSSASFLSTSHSGEFSPRPPLQPAFAPGAHVSDLADVPSAAHIESIHPQTMTVNLVVGIISIEPERQVRTRWGGTRTLAEVVVGDETKSGFSITFWFDPDSATSAMARNPLEDLRRQDVIMLRNVALHTFMRKVHGQGLRRAVTKVHLLHRRRLDADDNGGCYSAAELASCVRNPATHPQLQKTIRVREWVTRFVGGGGTRVQDGKRKRAAQRLRAWDVPPPHDTQ